MSFQANLRLNVPEDLGHVRSPLTSVANARS